MSRRKKYIICTLKILDDINEKHDSMPYFNVLFPRSTSILNLFVFRTYALNLCYLLQTFMSFLNIHISGLALKIKK